MTPTRQGLAVLGLAAVLGVAALVLGTPEFGIGAGAAWGALLVGTVPLLRSPALDARRVAPLRVSVGDVVTTRLEVRRLRGPRVCTLCDVVDHVPTGDLALLFSGGAPVELTRRVVATRRGILQLGPATATVTDPLGLFRRGVELTGTHRVLVRPRVIPLGPPPQWGGREPDSERTGGGATHRTTHDLAGLRPYQDGDDLRHMHWPTVARTGRPVVRHYELPEEARLRLILDTRSGVHRDDSFERAVVAVASVVVSAQRTGMPVEFETTDGSTRWEVDEPASLDGLLDFLALVHPSPGGHPPHRRAREDGGIEVICTGGSTARELISRSAAVPSTLAPVVIDVTTTDSSSSGGASVIRFGAGSDLGEAWDAWRLQRARR